MEYVFVSRMESDEAGGLTVLKEVFPNIKVICGQLAARELPGWGYTGEVVAKCGGEVFKKANLTCRLSITLRKFMIRMIFWYLIKHRGIFYSSDLMQRFGGAAGKTIQASWADEVNVISDSPCSCRRKARKAQGRTA